MAISLAELTAQQQNGATPPQGADEPIDLSFLDQGSTPETPSAPPPPLKVKPLNLTIELNEEERDELGRRIVDEILAWQEAVSQRIDNLREWRRQWEVMPDSGPSGVVWDNPADTPSPHVRVYCGSHQARLNTQIISPKPPFTVVARKPAALEACPVIEDALSAILDAAEWPSKADLIHQELVVAGNVFVDVTWKQEWVRRPQKQVETVDEDAHALVAAGLPPHEALWRSVKKLHFGHEDVLTYSGVDLAVLPFEDGFLAPADAREPEEAYAIGKRVVLRGDELKAGVKRGVYLEAAVEELLERTQSSIPEDRWERLDDQGLSLSGSGRMGTHDPLYKRFVCYELNWQGDFDGDGQLEWARITLDWESGKILRCQYLDYEHGRPSTMLFRYITRPGELLGMGIPELIATYVDADAATLCSLVNHADLVLSMGLFFYDTRSGLKPHEFLAQLGRPIKVEDVEGIKQIPPMALPSEQYTLRNIWKEICDLLTASSNPTLGRETSTNKTLGEIQIVQSQANTLFEDYAARVARNCHAKVWDQCRWLTAQFGTQTDQGEVEYRRTAAPDLTEFAGIPPRMLTADVDLVPAGLEQLSDIGTRIQIATLVRQTFIADPLVQGNWEAQKIIDGEYLHAVRYSKSRQLLAAMEKQNAANIQAAQQQAAMAQQQAGEIARQIPALEQHLAGQHAAAAWTPPGPGSPPTPVNGTASPPGGP